MSTAWENVNQSEQFLDGAQRLYEKEKPKIKSNGVRREKKQQQRRIDERGEQNICMQCIVHAIIRYTKKRTF